MSEVDGSSLKTITGFILYVYRFPNMLAENKNPTAYGTDGECKTPQPVLSLPKGRNSNIENPASSVLCGQGEQADILVESWPQNC